jgi:hypothetical protein
MLALAFVLLAGASIALYPAVIGFWFGFVILSALVRGHWKRIGYLQ